MKRALMICGMVMAFAIGALAVRSAGAVQQNGVFNAQSTQPRAPQQVLFKIDLPPFGQPGNDDFFMLAIFTRADQTAQSYYGFFDKMAAIRLRDALNLALDGPPSTPVASSRSFQLAAVAQPTPICARRDASVPADAVLDNYQGSSKCWHWRKGSTVYAVCDPLPAK